MEDNINSLKDAINITLHKYNYPVNDNVLRKLIKNSLTGNPNLFTREPNAREYVQKLGYLGVLKELKYSTRSLSNDVNVLIDEYIKKFYSKTSSTNIIDVIKKNSNFDKIAKKIRYLSTVSENDEDFKLKVWEYFSSVFVSGDKYITTSEIRCDMIEAALIKAEMTRDDVVVLKTLDPNGTDLSEMDALKIVEEYVYSGNITELALVIDKNKVLSGLLLQNLFDYVYFDKYDTKEKEFKLDISLGKITNVELKYNVISQLISGSKIEGIDISKEEALLEILRNSLLVKMYSNTNFNDLYVDKVKLNIDLVKGNNNQIIDKIINSSSDIDNLVEVVNNLSDGEKDFLARLYSMSRTNVDNRKKLDNSIYYGTVDQTNLLNTLESEDLLERLSMEQKTI